MPSRSGSPRVWIWAAAPAALVLTLLFACPVAAQPPSPLELVRGLRENGQVDLALEYLKELEETQKKIEKGEIKGTPLSADDKAALLMERARCLLDGSESEPDEGTRLSMVTEAREQLNTFLITYPKHPRRVEALVADAKLKTLDAREQLNRARRVELPPIIEGTDAERQVRSAAAARQKKAAAEALPMFKRASDRYAEASKLLTERLAAGGLDPVAQRDLERQILEAELAAGINLFNIAETFMPDEALTAADKKLRDKYLDDARTQFGKLTDKPLNNRSVWVAKAWLAEITFEQNDFNKAAAEVDAIMKTRIPEADEGKRLARFFHLRRMFLAAMSGTRIEAEKCEFDLNAWLRTYGSARKPTPEVFAIKYYLGRILQRQATLIIGPPPKVPPKVPPPIPALARDKLKAAEKVYRELGQSDHDYTARATRQRMNVVRQLLENADRPARAYTTFEEAQMASLIRLGNLSAAEATPAETADEQMKKDENVRKLRLAVVELLERARALATPSDNPADVTDVMLRLIYYYRITGQPYQAAVLGEYMLRNVKTTGGKAAQAGLIALDGYLTASQLVKIDDPEARAAARKADRERAVAIARYLDEKFPSDTATDSARHQLALLLLEENKFQESYDIVQKVRPGYVRITDVRLLEGFLASKLILDPALKLTDPQKVAVFRQTTANLVKVPPPDAIAPVEAVRSYLLVRCRYATMLLARGRLDMAQEMAGYVEAQKVAEEVLRAVPSFDCLVEPGGMKKPNPDGMEILMVAHDALGRAIYLRAIAQINAGQFPAAAQTLQATLDEVRANGAMFNDQMKAWAEGAAEGTPEAVQKAKVAQLAAGVDKTRVEVILAGFRMFAKQGKGAEAAALLDLMEKAGGKIEDNLPTLETMGREMAAQLTALKRDPAKAADAKNLSDGLGILVERLSKLPNLPSSSKLFLGQTLIDVGKPDQAAEVLKTVPVPTFEGWQDKKLDEFPKEVQGELANQIGSYALSQMLLARAYRESNPPRLDDAEKMLKEIVGTQDKKGWGYGRLYFRKELAAVYEAKGAAAPDAPKSLDAYKLALAEWNLLFAVARNRITSLPKDATPEQIADARSEFADAFLDYHKCIVKANKRLQPPDKFLATCNDIAKKFVDIEKQIPLPEFKPEVRNRYHQFLVDMPELMTAYKAAQGKLFLEKAPLQ